MSSSRQNVLENTTPETRTLRSRSIVSTPDQVSGSIERRPDDEMTRSRRSESQQPAKRIKISQETSTDRDNVVATPIGMPFQATTEIKPSLRESSAPLSAKEPGEAKRRTWTLPKTKRASSLNLHNHPVISHPSNFSDDERSPSTSMPTSPGGIRPSTELGAFGARIDRPESSTSFSFKSSSLTGAQPLWGQSNVNEHEDDTSRRRAQRDRKTKQRSENWAKNKENDVVARAKLEAKKKYGMHAHQEIERRKFVDERVRDDYGRLLGRQTAQFADALAQLAPFRVGHSDDFVASSLPRFESRHPYVQAGKLLLDVLPALAEPQVSDRSQRAADALLLALENGNPDEGSFFSFIDVLSDDETIQRGIDKVLGQLLNARPEDRRASRSQASPTGGQLAPSVFGTSPDSAGLSLKRLTWKEPATLKANNFAPSNNLESTPDERANERPRRLSSPSNAQQDINSPLTQTRWISNLPSSADLTPSTGMPPPPPAQARSSGRERKPTAKVLAAGAETPPRQPAATPSVASRPILTRNSRSAPRVPSRLGLSELAADREEITPATTALTAGQDQHTSSESISSTVTTTFTPTIKGPLIPPVVPRSLQQLPPNILTRGDSQPVVDPKLTANLLQLAEIAANMSESDDEELEMESHDLPQHERLIRELYRQERELKYGITTPILMEQPGKLAKAAPLSSSHSQTKPVNAASTQSTLLPPVNTTMSIRDAQAASDFFKSLGADEPIPNARNVPSALNIQNAQPAPKTQSAPPTHSETMDPYAGPDKRYNPAQNLHRSNTMTNSIAPFRRWNGAGSGASITQPPRPGGQIAHADRNMLSGKTQFGAFNTNGEGTVLPQLSQPESQVAITRLTNISPNRPLLPFDRKRKFEDEGNDIAMNRLRMHAASRGIAVDGTMSFERLNAMIDNHDKITSYAHGGTNGPGTSQISTRPYNNGSTNGSTSHGSTAPSPTLDRPSSSEGLRRLAPSSSWPGYNHLYPSYNIAPPISPAAQYPPPPNNMSHPDGLRSPNGHINKAYGKTFQFVPPKQPEQFSSQNLPVTDKLPSITNGADPRQQHQDALNGGPPGGGAVINSRANKRQQTATTSDYKFHVNAKDKRIPQSQPKRGGQLMNFG